MPLGQFDIDTGGGGTVVAVVAASGGDILEAA
jgi:hypothetical protein